MGKDQPSNKDENKDRNYFPREEGNVESSTGSGSKGKDSVKKRSREEDDSDVKRRKVETGNSNKTSWAEKMSQIGAEMDIMLLSVVDDPEKRRNLEEGTNEMYEIIMEMWLSAESRTLEGKRQNLRADVEKIYQVSLGMLKILKTTIL